MADHHDMAPQAALAERRKQKKIAFLKLCRALGLFGLARRLTSRRWRILCYHGFSIGDQHEYAPILFMRSEVFRRRMEALKRLRVQVISLDEGLEQIKGGAIDGAPVTITIDDGWKTTFTQAAPILKEFAFPACVYVTTYYCEKQAPVFNVVIWYMLWKTKLKDVELHGIHPQLDGRYDLRTDQSVIGNRWIKTVEANFNVEERSALLGKFASALGLDIVEVLQDERFKLMSGTEVVTAAKEYALDIQLHTHRHRLPQDSAALVTQEIEENRRILEGLTTIPSVHFCYPSGVYSKDHPQWLSGVGVRSATTCDAGTNDSSASPLLLKRYLDRDDWSDIEFESVVVGFSDLINDLRRRVKGLLGRQAAAPDPAMNDARYG